jgi:hypothetical protein
MVQVEKPTGNTLSRTFNYEASLDLVKHCRIGDAKPVTQNI